MAKPYLPSQSFTLHVRPCIKRVCRIWATRTRTTTTTTTTTTETTTTTSTRIGQVSLVPLPSTAGLPPQLHRDRRCPGRAGPLARRRPQSFLHMHKNDWGRSVPLRHARAPMEGGCYYHIAASEMVTVVPDSLRLAAPARRERTPEACALW